MSISGLSIKIERKKTYDEARAHTLAGIILWAFILTYAVYFSAYQIQLHRTFHTGLDLVSIEQPLWNTLHGRFMRATYYPVNGEIVTDFTDRRTESLFGDHFQPSLLALLPVYAIFPRAENLMIALCIIVGLGALPLYNITLRRLNSPWQSLLFSVGYLMLPAIQTLTSHDIHAAAFLPPLILGAFDAMERGKRGWFLLFVLLAFGLREDIPVHLGWAFLIMAPKVKRREMLFLMGAGVLWSMLSFFWIIPGYGGGETPYLIRYFPLGTELTIDGIIEVMKKWEFWRIDILNFVLYNIRLGLPFLYLYFLFPKTVLAVAPMLVLNGVSWYAFTQFPNQFHYSSPVVPWLFIGVVEGYRRLAALLSEKRSGYNGRGAVGVALATGIIAAHFITGYTPLARNFQWPRLTGREDSIKELLCQIPQDASVSAEGNLAAHLGRRETLRFFPDIRNVDWIVFDERFGDYPYYMDIDETMAIWNKIYQDPLWEIDNLIEGVILLNRSKTN